MKKTIIALAGLLALSFCTLQPAYSDEACADIRDVVSDLNSRGFTPALSSVFDGFDAEVVMGVIRAANPDTPLPSSVSRVAVLFLSEEDMVIVVHDSADCVRALIFAPSFVLDEFAAAIARSTS